MKKLSVSIRLLIFDMDGTLANTLEDLAEAANFSLQRLQRPAVSLAQVQTFVGDGMGKLLERALGPASVGEMEETITLFQQYYAEHCLDHTRLYPGIPEMLRHYTGHAKAVLTNKPHSYALKMAEQLALTPFMKLVIGGQPKIALKPAPDGIRFILEQLRCRPEETVMIGDSPNDILAGKAAGTYTCAVNYGYRAGEHLRSFQPDFQVDRPEELIGLF